MNTIDIKVDYLEKEVISSRDKAIHLSAENVKLKKEIFLLEEEIKNKDDIIKEKNIDIKDFKKQLFSIQNLSDDMAEELEKSLNEVKYWYNIKSPTFKTVFNIYKINIMKFLKESFDNFLKKLFGFRCS